MNKRGDYGSMADRVSARRSATDGTPSGLKHCWVTTRDGRLPGLLLEWRKSDDEWRGRVVHPVQEDHSWVVVEQWLPAGLLDQLRPNSALLEPDRRAGSTGHLPRRVTELVEDDLDQPRRVLVHDRLRFPENRHVHIVPTSSQSKLILGCATVKPRAPKPPPGGFTAPRVHTPGVHTPGADRRPITRDRGPGYRWYRGTRWVYRGTQRRRTGAPGTSYRGPDTGVPGDPRPAYRGTQRRRTGAPRGTGLPEHREHSEPRPTKPPQPPMSTGVPAPHSCL